MRSGNKSTSAASIRLWAADVNGSSTAVAGSWVEWANHGRRRMTTRFFGSLLVLIGITTFSLPAQSARSAARTPWGEPDIQGTWTSESELGVPFERPTEFGDRQ